MRKLNELMSMRGKTSLIAGGAGYLGTSISETLAELGSDVIIASRNFDKCDELAKKIEEEYQVRAMALELDITSQKSIKDCIKSVETYFKTLDSLVVSSWSGEKNSWDTISREDWDKDIEVCLNGVFGLIKESVELLRKKKGNILTIGSMYGYVAPDWKLYDGVPQVNPPSYGAAKAGVVQLTKYLASFLGPDGIRVNCLSPGPFPFPEVIEAHPEFVKRLENKNPLGKIGKPEELKGAVALLCSEGSTYITGQNICVDGGWGIW